MRFHVLKSPYGGWRVALDPAGRNPHPAGRAYATKAEAEAHIAAGMHSQWRSGMTSKRRTSKNPPSRHPARRAGDRDNRAEDRLARAESRRPWTAKDAADVKAQWARDDAQRTPEFVAAEKEAHRKHVEAFLLRDRQKLLAERAMRRGVKPNIDRRDLARMVKAFPEGAQFDEGRMRITFELDQDEGEPLDCDLPVHFGVCGTCDGKGTHVNPSIDSHGISPEEFDEDPDFAEAYHSGAYDVACAECGGQRVVPVVDESRADKKCLDALREWQRGEYENARDDAYTRRMESGGYD